MTPSDANPYSPPHAGVAEPERGTTRAPWLAALLGLIAPPIAMLYVARPLRALAYLAAMMLSLPAIIFLGTTDLTTVLPVLLSVAAAADGYRIARRWNGRPLPWYSRTGALVVIYAVGIGGILGLRQLAAEPFRMASGSMEPTLRIGEHVLISKTSYGWSSPFDGRRIVTFARPQRGEVAVFRYPANRNLNYLKRIVAGPGDTIVYEDKRLSVNGSALPRTERGTHDMNGAAGIANKFLRYEERLDEVAYSILLNPSAPPFSDGAVRQFEGREHCSYVPGGFTCSVPKGHYFVLGDNRDHSDDSRYWGFVKEAEFIGRAFAVR